MKSTPTLTQKPTLEVQPITPRERFLASLADALALNGDQLSLDYLSKASALEFCDYLSRCNVRAIHWLPDTRKTPPPQSP